ncbi:unnamed protein product, partial [Clonostachys byssicola]
RFLTVVRLHIAASHARSYGIITAGLKVLFSSRKSFWCRPRIYRPNVLHARTFQLDVQVEKNKVRFLFPPKDSQPEHSIDVYVFLNRHGELRVQI